MEYQRSDRVADLLMEVLAELLRRENCGLTYDNGRSDRLVAALTRLYDDEAMRAEMARNARRLFEREYVAERIYDEMVGHLERIAARSSGLRRGESAGGTAAPAP